MKFDVLDVQRGKEGVVRAATGSVERIGSRGRASLQHEGESTEREVTTEDHRAAFAVALELLGAAGLMDGIEALGHRVVHGGAHFASSTQIDEDVVEAIRSVSDLAPLHNEPALAVIEAAKDSLPDVPAVAAFDTAFFTDLPEVAARYAIPRHLSEEHDIRRFGFHGLAHQYMVERFQALRPAVVRPRLITLQLGSGCSVTASFDGLPVDTSMGYTPLEGLVMGTRSGDIDPALPLRLQALSGKGPDEIETLLNKESGLLGLAGHSEMRDLVSAVEAGDNDARIAVEIFCRSAKKYLGAYLAVLGGADGVIFGGGIGENIPDLRRRICNGLEWAGLVIDATRNEQTPGSDLLVSSETSRIDVWVVHVDEAAVIARETLALLTD